MHQPVNRMAPREHFEDDTSPQPLPGFWVRLGRNLAAQDLLIAGYLFVLAVAVLAAEGPGRDTSIGLVGADVFAFAVGIFLTRGGILRHGSFAHALVYRLPIFLTVFLSYFELRFILPAHRPLSFDA